ncbi:putative membrane protein [Vibrio parahaemolyticus V-223/04]|nr:putative membrane protein [Vibrio parahaemolyticus V-223/04]
MCNAAAVFAMCLSLTILVAQVYRIHWFAPNISPPNPF